MSEYVIRSKSGMHLVSTEQDTGGKEMVFETKEQAEKVLEVVLRVFKNEEFEIVTTDRLRTERKKPMNTFWGMKISKRVEQLIRERMSLAECSYEFKLVGVAGNGYDRMTSVHLAFEKIKKWAEREGNVQLIHDEYEAILKKETKNRSPVPDYKNYRRATYKGQSKGYLLVQPLRPHYRGNDCRNTIKTTVQKVR